MSRVVAVYPALLNFHYIFNFQHPPCWLSLLFGQNVDEFFFSALIFLLKVSLSDFSWLFPSSVLSSFFCPFLHFCLFSPHFPPELGFSSVSFGLSFCSFLCLLFTEILSPSPSCLVLAFVQRGGAGMRTCKHLLNNHAANQ